MQKAGLLTALAVTVAVAIYAYPKSNRNPASLTKIGGIGTEHDNSAPTPLDKLKAATRVGVQAQDSQSVLPPPRVMEHVKQEIQARPALPETSADAKQAALRDAGEKAGMDKLVGKLPASAGQPVVPVAIAPPTPPAQTQSSNLVIPGAGTLGAAAAATTIAPAPAAGAALGEPKAVDADAETIDSTQAKSALAKSTKASASERRRLISRDSASAQRAPRASNGPTRQVRHSSVFGRNDGM